MSDVSVEIPAEVVCRVSLPVRFSKGDTSFAMIEKGRYSHVDPEFRDTRNLLEQTSAADCMLEAINFSQEITTDEVRRLLIKEMGKRPALPQHHLAVGYQYQETLFERLRRLYILNALGNKADRLALISFGRTLRTRVVDLDVCAAFTENDSFGTDLNLVTFQLRGDRVWYPHHFFLVTDC